jgi:segregation and condensation protein A
MDYKVKLEIFEGPMDLLLHLIKKNEVDIYDIPIATITEQYLEYIELIKSLNLDIAGEFILMAATLIHIKSKMLLPIDEEPEEAEEDGDPREELVRRLLEYKRYKDGAVQLEGRRLLGRDVFIRGLVSTDETEGDDGLVNLSVFDLIEALREVLERAPSNVSLNLSVEKFTVVDKINRLMEVLMDIKSATFNSLFSNDTTKGEIVVTFLAILELVKMKMIRVCQSEGVGIRIYIPDTAKNEIDSNTATKAEKYI